MNTQMITPGGRTEGRIVNQNGLHYMKTRNLLENNTSPLYRTEPKYSTHIIHGLPHHSDISREIHQAFYQQGIRYPSPHEPFDSPDFDEEEDYRQIESPRFQEPSADSDSIYSDSPPHSRPSYLESVN